MKKLGFIGGGNMAEALIRGLLGRGVFTASDLIASDVDRGRRQRLKRNFKIDIADSNQEVVWRARAVLIAVKPQNIEEVLAELKAAPGLSRAPSPDQKNAAGRRGPQERSGPLTLERRLFISIVAGITIARLSHSLGGGARIVRVM